MADNEKYQRTKASLRSSFKALRGQGYFARLSFAKNQGAAIDKLPKEYLKGRYVFSTTRDDACLKQKGYIFLAWLTDDPEFIRKTLTSNGLIVEWNGSPDIRMKVFTTER